MQLSKSRKGKASQYKTLMSFGVIMAVVVIGIVAMMAPMEQPTTPPADMSLLAAQLAAMSGVQTVDGAVVKECAGGQTQSFDLNVYDRENTNTAFTDPYLYREVGSVGWTAATEGTAITNIPMVGANYEFVLGISKSDFIDEAYGMYLRYNNIDCIVDVTDVESADNEAEDSVTWTFYNNDHNAEGQTLTANLNSKKVYPKVYASSENYFGNPYLQTYKDGGLLDGYSQRDIDFPNVLVLELNFTGMDRPNKVSVSGLSGALTLNAEGKFVRQTTLTSVELLSTACPSGTIHTPVSTDTNYCYDFPVIGDEELTMTIDVNVADAVAAVVDDAAYLYAAGLYLDDNGVLQMGIETDQNANVANDGSDSLTLDWTA